MDEGGKDLPSRDPGPIQPEKEKEIIAGAADTSHVSPKSAEPDAKKRDAKQHLEEELEAISADLALTGEKRQDLRDEAWFRFLDETGYVHPNQNQADAANRLHRELEAIRQRTDLRDNERNDLIDQAHDRYGPYTNPAHTSIMQNITEEISTVEPRLLDEHEPVHLKEAIKERKLFQEEAETVKARTYAELFIDVLQKLIEQQSVRQGLGDASLQVQNITDLHNVYRQMGSENFTLVQTLGAMKRMFFINYQTQGERPTLESLDLYFLVDQTAKQVGSAEADAPKT